MSQRKWSAALEQLEIEHTAEWIFVKSDRKWKTLSSAVLGAGMEGHHQFINRHVPKDYCFDDPMEEYRQFLHTRGITGDVLAMMTAAKLEDAAFMRSKDGAPELFIIVSVGTSNAVDASKAWAHPKWQSTIGTINTWVFIDGYLPKATFVQALITATEAKVKALHDEDIRDSVSGTIATGTSTDSVMIAATQTGPLYPYAGTITEVGKELARLVYEGTRAAVKRNKKRMGERT